MPTDGTVLVLGVVLETVTGVDAVGLLTCTSTGSLAPSTEEHHTPF